MSPALFIRCSLVYILANMLLSDGNQVLTMYFCVPLATNPRTCVIRMPRGISWAKGTALVENSAGCCFIWLLHRCYIRGAYPLLHSLVEEDPNVVVHTRHMSYLECYQSQISTSDNMCPPTCLTPPVMEGERNSCRDQTILLGYHH